MSEYLQVRNWKQFQHYRERDPKWFKVYRRLLTDADFASLKEWEQAQLFKLWLLAAASDNKLPSANSVLSRCIGSATSGRTRFRVDTFLELGYLEEWRAREEVPLAQNAKSASPEVETEVENNGSRSTSLAPNVVTFPLRQQSPPKDSTAAQCLEIFEHWKQARGKNGRSKLTETRRKKIKTRLRDFSVDDLKRAIDGVANDPWADRAQHDALEVILRSPEQVEKFLNLYEGPVGEPAADWQRTRARLVSEGVIKE